ncbi:MAG: hypothetical protein IPL53_03830 [Ignavibacteria bacterium]|nr:hypothetical protein [Ignavibacteria bacterium]
MKYLLMLLTAAILLFPELAMNSYSQSKEKQTGQENFKIATIKKSPDKSLEQIGGSKLKKAAVIKNQSSRNDLLTEDFESGIFPPDGWQNPGSGNILWNNFNISANGIGNYCAFYEFYGCELDNDDYLISPVFDQTDGSQYLVFDYAYAPAAENWYDSIEIFYSTDGGFNYSSLVIYNGLELQTAPYSKGPFEPQSNEWRTRYILLPAGTNVITFNSLNACANNFYMDNIRVGEYVPQYALHEDFESGNFPPIGWSVEDTFGWNNVNYTSGYGNGQYSSIFDFYICEHSDGTMTSPVFTPTQYGSYIYFDYAYAPRFDGWGDLYDNLEIFISTDDGNSYQSLEFITGEQLQTAPSTSDTNAFVPDNNQWATYSRFLPPGVNRIRFKAINGCGNNLFIDNIKVDGLPVNTIVEASVEFLWAKGKLPLVFGVPDKIPVLVKNNGDSTITNLKVYLNISGANNLSDSLVIPSIDAGDTMQVDFMGFMPVLNGFCDVTVSIPNDNNNSNNSKTYISEVNPNTIRYVDSNCCNSGVGWVGEAAFMNKHYMSGTGQIRNVNIKIGQNNQDQFVYGYVVSSSGSVLGKSPHYKIKATDGGKYVSFDITDPKPPIVTNDYYYVGIAQTEFAGDGFAFSPQELQYEVPARPDANFGAFLAPAGSNAYVFEFPRQYGHNYAIEAVIENQAATDVGISDQGPVYDQYFNTTSFTPVVKVFNAGTGSTTFNVRRTITPGGYTSTKSVTSLPSGANAFVNYDPWIFTAGTVYTVRDSVLISDGNNSNNQKTTTITPRIAKQMCVLWQQQTDRDSLVRSIISDGRYANNFDTVRMNYTGSYRPWKIMIVALKEEKSYSPWVRDSMKSFIDNSTAGNKKTLVLFSDAVANVNDPVIGYPAPADSIFYRQYLKAKTISDDWMGSISSSQKKFRGIGFFDGITQDSVSDPYTPELIKPTNGSSTAFKPQSVTGNGADSCIAVSFAGANYNTFFMTNQFSSLRATNGSPSSPMGPVRVYTKIIDWIQGVNLNVKVLDLTAQIEGYYDLNSNSMNTDTMRVYLRSSVNPYPKIDSAKALLNAAGQASFVFNNASNGVGYFIQLKHRNGLETWSKTTLSFTSNHVAYNFTSDSAKAFGNNMKKSGSKWLIFTGDADQNGFIDLTDVLNVYNGASAFVTGYVNTDVNGNNSVDLTDVILAYNNSSGFVKKQTPLPQPQFISVNGNASDDVIQSVYGNEIINESKIDHDIYNRFRDQQAYQKQDPDVVIYYKGKGKSIIEGINKKESDKSRFGIKKDRVKIQSS